MQPSKAPRRGSLLPVLAALLVLFLAAASADHKPRLLSVLNRRLEVDPSSPRVQKAARTAVNYYNYVFGWPGALRVPGLVIKAHVKFVPGVGRKYLLQFAMKDRQTEDYISTCHASVFYREAKPKPDVEISCFPEENGSERLMEEAALYRKLKEEEVSFELQYDLGVYSSSLIAWEKSSEDLSYTWRGMESAMPWRSDDNAPGFSYHIKLGDEWEKSFLSCYMFVSWTPLEVKYFCAPEDGSTESPDGSGEESGSTDEFSHEAENNF